MVERGERARSSRSRSRSARRRAQYRGAVTEELKEPEDRVKPNAPMNYSFKDITNPNQRMPVLVESDSINEAAERLERD